MLNVRQILVSASGRAVFRVCVLVSGVAVAGCGQSGALYLPKDPAAVNRATLPDLITPARAGNAK
jgi:predicted small lipoprotein YifL